MILKLPEIGWKINYGFLGSNILYADILSVNKDTITFLDNSARKDVDIKNFAKHFSSGFWKIK